MATIMGGESINIGGGVGLELTENPQTGDLLRIADYIFSNAPQGFICGTIYSLGLHCFVGHIYPDTRTYAVVVIFDAWGHYVRRYRREGSTTTVEF